MKVKKIMLDHISKACQICMRECHGEEFYYGGVGNNKCKVCKRKVCNIHFDSPRETCTDCSE
jgi:hypothetical protein